MLLSGHTSWFPRWCENVSVAKYRARHRMVLVRGVHVLRILQKKFRLLNIQIQNQLPLIVFLSKLNLDLIHSSSFTPIFESCALSSSLYSLWSRVSLMHGLYECKIMNLFCHMSWKKVTFVLCVFVIRGGFVVWICWNITRVCTTYLFACLYNYPPSNC